jgi:NADH dehydrogenase
VTAAGKGPAEHDLRHVHQEQAARAARQGSGPVRVRARVVIVGADFAGLLDYPARALVLQDGSTLGFDYLIVAAGAEANLFDVPGIREHGWPPYTLADAVWLRRHLLSALEQVATAAPAAAPIDIVVADGGPTDVQTAGALTA